MATPLPGVEHHGDLAGRRASCQIGCGVRAHQQVDQGELPVLRARDRDHLGRDGHRRHLADLALRTGGLNHPHVVAGLQGNGWEHPVHQRQPHHCLALGRDRL
ncbi:hypothetical protein, partial [Propioniciclava sp.]|uniref:hypothetical protein n=1 Tax=Propioniciclava sp. TaxID=2038686 RepID=UPI0026396CEE